MLRTRFIPHDQDREDQKAEEKAERRALRKLDLGDEIDPSQVRFEGLDPNDPEFESVEVFAEDLLDDDKVEFDHRELQCLNARTGLQVGVIRRTLEGYGFKLKVRGREKPFAGFSRNPHDRWIVCPSFGGGGGSSIMGMVD